MQRKLLFIIGVSCLGWGACTDSIDSTFICEDVGEYLGEFRLTEKSDSFWHYDNHQNRIYVDDLGNEMTLRATHYDANIHEQQIRIVCATPDWNQRERDYADVESRYVHYQEIGNTPNLFIWVSLNVNTMQISDTSETFMDLMSMGAGNTYYSFILSDRGNPDEIPEYYNPNFLAVVPDTTILNKNFQDVYYGKFTDTPIFFNTSKGIVAFYDSNETLYVLDRIE